MPHHVRSAHPWAGVIVLCALFATPHVFAQDQPTYLYPPVHLGDGIVQQQVTATTGFVLLRRTGPFLISGGGIRNITIDQPNVAPAGALVTRVEYRLKVEDEGNTNFQTSDYEIQLERSNRIITLLDRPGGTTDAGTDDDPEDDADLEIEWRTVNYFNGLLANAEWGIEITDYTLPDDGQLTFFELRIHYAQTNGSSYVFEQVIAEISRVPAGGTGVQDLVTSGLSNAETSALDASAGKLYWTNRSNGKIQRANLDGSGVEDVLTGLSQPTGIALDPARGKLYWTARALNSKIQRANLDGTGIEDLVTAPSGASYFAITLDLVNAKIYWTDFGLERIMRANLDGSDEETVVSGNGIMTPFGIALDPIRERIYWSDLSANTIRRVRYDGSNIEPLFSNLSGAESIAFDQQRSQLYWVESGSDAVYRAQTLIGFSPGATETLVSNAGLQNARGLSFDPASSVVYWTDIFTNKIQRAGVRQQLVDAPLIASVLSFPDVEADFLGEDLYWTNVDIGSIQTAKLDGTSVRTLVTGQTDPEGLALDVANGRMYWTSRTAGSVFRADLDGSSVQTLFSGLPAPASPAVDVGNGKLYWTDESDGSIQRSNLDGSSPEEALAPDTDLRRDLVIDEGTSRLYWANATQQHIAYAPLNSMSTTTILSGLGSVTDIALDPANAKIHWATSNSAAVRRANLDGTEAETLTEDQLTTPYGLAVAAAAPMTRNLVVHLKRPAGWGFPHTHYFNSVPNIGMTVWPGEPMVAEGCGWYRYELPGATSASIVFNGNVFPQTVDLVGRDREGWYLPDPAPASGNYTGTWYDANPDGECSEEVKLTAQALLQGPYDPAVSFMTTSLKDANLLPANQPFTGAEYDEAPIEYNGTEASDGLGPIGGIIATDWALVELRTDQDDPRTTVARRAGIMTNNGVIIDTETLLDLEFPVPAGDYYAVVRTRNHVPVVSAVALTLGASEFFYSFNDAATQAASPDAMIEVEPGVWALRTGDADGDGAVTALDIVNVWQPESTQGTAYLRADFDLSGSATVTDVLLWLVNNGLGW
ncbi:MAG: starch-binding protein [Bacteroidota bacterium]